MGFISDNKTLIIIGIVSILAIAGFTFYWFYIRPKYSQEKVIPTPPAPVRVTPAGTSHIPQAQIRKLPRPEPEVGQSAHKRQRISPADAVRRREESENDGEDPVTSFFETTGFGDNTEYEREER